MKSKLPPLNSLVAFESTARWLSFTKAADELCVTQGAVSRQIRNLEEFLGVSLFERTKPLTLSETGGQYYESISLPLNRIRDATQQVRSFPQEEVMTIVSTNAIAAFWLLPRYARFQQEYQDANARIVVVDSISQLGQIEFDLGLYHCRQPPDGFKSTPLFEEKVFPVCSQDFFNAHPEITDLDQLAKTTLLVLESAEDWLGWNDWFAALGKQVLSSRRIKLNSYPLIIQSALNGQGVALAWQTLVDDYLESGLLVSPTEKSLSTSSMFYLLEPDRDPPVHEMARRFSTWLQQSLDAT